MDERFRHLARSCVAAIAAFAIIGSPGARAAGDGPWQTHPLPDALPGFVILDATRSAVIQPDGWHVYVGMFPTHVPNGFTVVRADANGVLDPSFGHAGIAFVPIWGAADVATAVALQTDGGIVVGGTSVDPSGVPACGYYAFCNHYVAIARLDRQGRPDPAFNGNGRVTLRIGTPLPGAEEDFSTDAIAIAADGTIVVHLQYPEGYAFIGEEGSLETQSGDVEKFDIAIAVDYHDAVRDLYYSTSDLAEIATYLAAGLPDSDGEWYWAGGGFHVYPAGSAVAGTYPVCRYARKVPGAFGARMLTAYPGECEWLAQRPGDWVLESSEVFRVGLPDAVTGACLPGAMPVYRLWNGRADGGHHLTVDATLRARLIGEEGYVPEGAGPLGVAMCAAP
jgi:hypothetical protein